MPLKSKMCSSLHPCVLWDISEQCLRLTTRSLNLFDRLMTSFVFGCGIVGKQMQAKMLPSPSPLDHQHRLAVCLQALETWNQCWCWPCCFGLKLDDWWTDGLVLGSSNGLPTFMHNQSQSLNHSQSQTSQTSRKIVPNLASYCRPESILPAWTPSKPISSYRNLRRVDFHIPFSN